MTLWRLLFKRKHDLAVSTIGLEGGLMPIVSSTDSVQRAGNSKKELYSIFMVGLSSGFKNPTHEDKLSLLTLEQIDSLTLEASYRFIPNILASNPRVESALNGKQDSFVRGALCHHRMCKRK